MSDSVLIEIGCEELPSSCLKQLGIALKDLTTAKLAALKLDHGDVHWYAAPRRLAVLVKDVPEQGPDENQEALGPPVAQAKDDDGNWTRAAQGFAAKQGVDPDALEEIDTPKGVRLGIRRVVPGARTREVLAELLKSTIDELPVPKRMRWGAGRLEFARPIHWLVLMHGSEHGFGDVHGITTGNESRGHRFHAPEAVTFASADAYLESLKASKVIADFEERCVLIKEQVVAQAEALGAQAIIDEDLLDEVASLVEWPSALAGGFDESFLEVPAEALISSMQSHQKYFPVVDADGNLKPNFITVSNIESRDPAQVIAGNEKVIRPRLADAAFFFVQDRQHTLASRLTKLDAVVFQQKLGSIGDKSRRVSRLAGELAALTDADRGLAERAGELCKADLVSEMVLEFSDMQGIAGAYYARADGEDSLVADAIEQHYWPLQSGSALPASPVAAAVALADRLDTLVGIFGIGQTPTGSKDPFGLRRASIAVLRLIIDNNLDLDLRAIIALALSGFEDGVIAAGTDDTVIEYMLDRLPALYEGEGYPVESFRAVRSTGCTEPSDFARRLAAVKQFSEREEADALAAANKRVSNILAKAEDGSVAADVSANLLQETQEKDLHAAIQEVASANADDLAAGEYAAALTRLAALRGPVDAFFDGVMVNAEDPELRGNRLALLSGLRQQFVAIADISQLAA